MNKQPPTAAALREQIEAAKVTARRNFHRDWGADLPTVIGALRRSIPGSVSPGEAARRAVAALRVG